MICQDMSEVGTKRKTKYYAVGSCVIKSNLSLRRLSWMCNDDAIRDLVSLHNVSKEVFRPKEFLNFMIGFIWQFFNSGKMALLNFLQSIESIVCNILSKKTPVSLPTKYK